MTDVDIAIIGNGPTARLAWSVLNRLPLDVCLIGPEDPRDGDPRTTALMPGAVDDLTRLGIDVADLATPLERLEMHTTGPFGAVARTFAADEVGAPHLALNVPVTRLIERLPVTGRIATTVDDCAVGAERATLRLSDGGRVSARLVVAADGTGSVVRDQAGLRMHRRSIDRDALCLPVAHAEHDHRNTCVESYDDWGTITLIPMAGRRSSLITLDLPRRIDRIADLDDGPLGEKLTKRLDAFGPLRPDGPRARFPMSFGWVTDPVAPRVVAIGEAAHVVPPLAAQGWNLSIRDVLELWRTVSEALDRGEDIGDPRALLGYGPRRFADMVSRVLAVRALAFVGSHSVFPIDLARQAGLIGLTALGPAKRGLMRAGMEVGRLRQGAIGSGSSPATPVSHRAEAA